jgi:hypothetical protein
MTTDKGPLTSDDPGPLQSHISMVVGCGVNTPDASKTTPLMVAAYRANMEVMKHDYHQPQSL